MNREKTYLSKRIAKNLIKIRKKFIKKVKYFLIYGNWIIRLIYVIPVQAISLVPPNQYIMRPKHSSLGLNPPL